MFSLAEEELHKTISFPPDAACSRIIEKEAKNEHSHISAAAEFGPKLRKELSRKSILLSKIHHYGRQLIVREKQLKLIRNQLKLGRRKLSKTLALTSERLLNVATNVPSQAAKTTKSLTPEQIADIRNKFIFQSKDIWLFRPIPPRNEPSHERDVTRKIHKSQKLIDKETALKREIVALAKKLEKIEAPKNFPAVKLSAVPYHASQAIRSEYYMKLEAVKAQAR
jgi:hypothetical protein